MKEVNSALTSLKSEVESDNLSSADVPQDCCKDGMYQPNFRFRANVTLFEIINVLKVAQEFGILRYNVRCISHIAILSPS